MNFMALALFGASAGTAITSIQRAAPSFGMTKAISTPLPASSARSRAWNTSPE